jgi:hypothetical protein
MGDEELTLAQFKAIRKMLVDPKIGKHRGPSSDQRGWYAGGVRQRSGRSSLRITSGTEHVATFQKADLSQRQYCTKCGGHLMTNHPPLGLVDVFAATIPTLTFTPKV